MAEHSAGRVSLHPCFPQGLSTASIENTGEGGTPALFVSKEKETKMKIQTIIGNLAIAVVVAGCGTLKDGQETSVAKASSLDGGYVPGLQQGVFENLGRQVSTNFNSILSCGKTCADAKRHTHTLGTILADVDQRHAVKNELTGSVETFNEKAAILYEGEIYLEGGKEYNFFVVVDDWASIEIDGKKILSGGYGEWKRGYRLKKGSPLFASKRFAMSGWYPIRVWVCDSGRARGAMLGFGGMGIGWNATGCKELNASNFSQWHPLRDDGSGCFLRSKRLP